MPFTPFHMGPGLLIKALLQSSFSLLIFGWTQIVMDIPPLIAIVHGSNTLHGFTHTYAGAIPIAIISAVTGKYLSEWVLTHVFDVTPIVPIRWWVALLSSFIGSISHVLLDSIMHADLAPLSPFKAGNDLLGDWSVGDLHRFCIYSGLLGAAMYFVVQAVRTRSTEKKS